MLKVIELRTIKIAVTIAVILGCGTYGILHHRAASMPAASSLPHDELRSTALVTTYLKELQEASNQYYADYLAASPQIAYYETSVKEITSEGSKIYIVFSTRPYIGPHDAVGEDEITFSVDHAGTIRLETFDHIKGYSLPDTLKDLLKRPIPLTGG